MPRTHHAKSDQPGDRAGMVAVCVSFALQHGMDLDDVEQIVDVRGLLEMNPEARVPDHLLATLWGRLVELHPDLPIALEMSRSAPLSFVGELPHAAQFASSLVDAIRLFVRNSVLVGDRLVAQLHESEEEAAFCLHHPLTHLDHGSLNELGLGFTWRVLSEIARCPPPVLRVELEHRPTGPAEAYEEHFGCEVRFGAARNALVWRPEDLTTPPNQANIALFAFAQEHLHQSRERLEQSSLAPDQRLLAKSIRECAAQGRFDSRSVAAGAGMSLRTAQRVATDQGTPLAEMIRMHRQDLARDALQDPRLGSESVARLVGYSDERSFRRAFQSWTGQSPAQYRRSGA